jgi:hypothetical protein
MRALGAEPPPPTPLAPGTYRASAHGAHLLAQSSEVHSSHTRSASAQNRPAHACFRRVSRVVTR